MKWNNSDGFHRPSSQRSLGRVVVWFLLWYSLRATKLVAIGIYRHVGLISLAASANPLVVHS